jgi:hypothetical protein
LFRSFNTLNLNYTPMVTKILGDCPGSQEKYRFSGC